MERCPSFLWQTDEQTHIWQVVLQGSRDGQKQGPRDRKAEQELREDGPSRRDSGRLGPDSRDAGQRTTTDSKMKRQGGPKRYRQRRRVPSGLFPSRQPGIVLSLGAADPRRAKHTPSPSQPAGQSACLSARRCPPARAGKGSHCSRALPPTSLSLTSFCSACAKPIWNCLNPNIQSPPPPARFLHSLKQALRWLREEGRGRREGRVGGGRRRRERGRLFISV